MRVPSSNKLTLKVQCLDRDLPKIHYASAGSAGFDLRSRVDYVFLPGMVFTVPTGIALELPQGWEVQIRSRSGLAAKHGIAVLNAPGTIDSDFRGEIQVILMHCGKEPFHIERGMRVAQGVLSPVVQASFEWVEDLSSTERGEGGLGSTGLF